MSQSDPGRQIAAKLCMASGVVADGAEIDVIRVAFGPDLEVIHAQECTMQRCRESCTPSYRLMLRQCGFEADADAETGEGCGDGVFAGVDDQS